MRDLLSHLEEFARATTSPLYSTFAETNVQAAIPVVTERIAICDPAGTVKPEDFLPADRREEFLRVDERIREDWQEASSEGLLHGLPEGGTQAEVKTVGSKMAVLTPVEDPARSER